MSDESGYYAKALKERETFDYILVFPNPFQKELPSPLCNDVTLEQGQNVFNDIFRTIAKEQMDELNDQLKQMEQGMILSEADAKLLEKKLETQSPITGKWVKFERKALEQGRKTVKFAEIVQLIMTCILKVLQERYCIRLRMFYSGDKDEIFVKLQCSDENYKIHADLIDYQLQLRRQNTDVKNGYSEVMPYSSYDMRELPESAEQIHAELAASLNLLTVQKNKNNLYKHYDSLGKQLRDAEGCAFKYNDKVRLLLNMISSVADLGTMQERGVLHGNFPVHHTEMREYLRSTWGTFRKVFQGQNVREIRRYFGEKIAMYFAWLRFYILWLIGPATLGLVCFILQTWVFQPSNNSTESELSYYEITVLVYSILISLAATLFEQLWIRQQNKLAWQWGTYNVEEVQQQRAGFKGKYIKDPISGKMKKASGKIWISKAKRSLGYLVSVLFVALVLCLLIAIFILKAINGAKSTLGRAAAVINAFQIKIMNLVKFIQIYRVVAKKMTNWENYEYESEYIDALTIKLFMFSFINSYSSLVYIAFFKEYYPLEEENRGPYNEEEIARLRMSELSVQLGTIFVINMMLNLIEIGLPYVSGKYSIWKEKRKIEQLRISGQYARLEMSAAEREAKLSEYEQPIDDYMEIVIDYGYIVLFSSAFPIVPFLSLLMCNIELRIDAWKLCNLTRRPYPDIANSIGVWYTIIQSISYAGCLTNAGIIIFTSGVFGNRDWDQRWLIFLGIEHALLLAKVVLSILIPDVPSTVRKALVWGKRIVNERVFGKPSDQDEQRQARKLFYKEFEGAIKCSVLEKDIYSDNPKYQFSY